MPYVITEICVKDGSCVEVCPVNCIHTTPTEPQFFIDPDVCIECEQCVLVCPVNAVFLDSELPAEWETFITVNAEQSIGDQHRQLRSLFRERQSRPELQWNLEAVAEWLSTTSAAR